VRLLYVRGLALDEGSEYGEENGGRVWREGNGNSLCCGLLDGFGNLAGVVLGVWVGTGLLCLLGLGLGFVLRVGLGVGFNGACRGTKQGGECGRWRSGADDEG
jgi:hypothetical protein